EIRFNMRNADQFFAAFFELFATQTIKAPVKLQVLMHGQFVVEGKLLRHVTDDALDLFGFGFDIVTGDFGAAFGWLQNCTSPPNHRRFARTVRSETAEYRS